MPPRKETSPLAVALMELLDLRVPGQDPYLDLKFGSRAAQFELLRAYDKIASSLANAAKVLDWGCRHGVYSQLLRADRGEAIELHGCDVCDPDQYRRFYEASGLQYQQLSHPWNLPYADATMDAVIAGGTLEHVPNDGASLTELWRVLRPGGVLAITHLPNATSWTEFVSRRLFPTQAHLRRYRLRTMSAHLLHSGFVVERSGYHQVVPSSLPPTLRRHAALTRTIDALQPLNAFERGWVIRRASATLWLVARKHVSL